MTQVTPPTAPLPPTTGAPPPRPPEGEAWLPLVRILAGFVVVGLLACGTILVVSSFFQRTHTESKDFAGTVTAVEVSEDVGDVDVRALPAGGTTRVTARLTASFQDARWSAELQGSTLVVVGDCSEESLSLFNCSVDLALDLPPGIPVQVRSATGDLDVDGGFSAVDVRTSTGDVVVRNATGSVKAQTDTGDVRSLSTAAKTVDVETDTGDVRVVFTGPPDFVTARTNTGDVTVSLPDDATVYTVSTETDTGDARVDVPNVPSSTHRVMARTDTGDIKVTYT